MSTAINIGERSRSFQLAVVVVSFLVILSMLVLVAGMSNSTESSGGVGDQIGDWLGGLGGGDQNVTNGDEFGDGDNNRMAPGNGSGGEGESIVIDEFLTDLSGTTSPDLDEGDWDILDLQVSYSSFRSMEPSTIFTVVADEQPRYMSTVTYNKHTDDGFEQGHSNSELYDFDEAPAYGVPDTPQQEQVIELEVDAARIPAQGFPVEVEVVGSVVDEDMYDFKRTESGDVVAVGPDGDPTELPEGTRLLITSHPFPTLDDISEDDVPEGHPLHPQEHQYNDISGHGSEASQFILEQIETDPSKPVMTTENVVEWFEENKEYRYGETHNPEHGVVADFIAEMDGGHSEYHAAAVTVVLREAGLHTRYVTGYKDGITMGPNRHEVHAMDKHAWVQVWMGEEVGWVTVDPSPEELDRDIKQWVRESDERALEYGVLETVIESPNDINAPDEDIPDDLYEPPYNITLQPDPTPGGEVVVEVTKHDTYLEGIEVYFNGEYVGTTDLSGTVVATVPYSETLTVEAIPGDDVPTDSTTQSIRGGTTLSGALSAGSELSLPVMQSNQSQIDYDLPTDIDVTPKTNVLPGSQLEIETSINDTPVTGANVYVNGDFVSQTDDNGEAIITVPEDAVGEITIGVERDEISNETTVPLSELEIETSPQYGVHLPGTPTEVTVYLVDAQGDAEPLPNASVVVTTDEAGAEIIEETTTDENGTLSLVMPWENSVYITAEESSVTASTSITGMYYSLGILAVIGLVLVLIVVILLYTRRHTDKLSTLKEYLINAMYGVAMHVKSLGTYAGLVVNKAKAVIVAVVTQPLAFLRSLSLPSGSGIGATVAAVPGRVVNWLYRVMQSLLGLLSRQPSTEQQSDPTREDPESLTVGDGDSPYEMFRSYWLWFVQFVIGRRKAATKSAVEIGKTAEAKGLPGGIVSPFVSAFQEVEYGHADAPSRLDVVKESVSKIRETITPGNNDN